MKKLYVCPDTGCFAIQPNHILTVSGVTDPNRDIDYGGVDEEGELDPAARVKVWEDEDIDEE